MQVFFGSDHAGFDLKEELKSYVEGLGFTVHDVGPYEKNEGDDYPDYSFAVAHKVAATPDSRGVVIGASGQGEAMAANRIKGVRAAVYYGDTGVKQADAERKELSILQSSRAHNDANILSIGARFVSVKEAKEALGVWLETDFTGSERHLRRIQKLDGENTQRGGAK